MTSPHLPTAPPGRLSHQVTRRQLEALLSPESPVSHHDRQRALVQASLLTRGPSHSSPGRRGGWVPG